MVKKKVETTPIIVPVLDETNKIPEARIDELLANSKVKTTTFFGNCLVMAVQLPNGYVIVESSGCIDPKNYSREIGKSICMEKVKNRLWALEGYLGANEFICK